MFIQDNYNKFYRETKKKIVNTVLNNSNSNKCSTGSNSNSYIDSLSIYKQILKLLNISLQDDPFKFQHMSYKIISVIASRCPYEIDFSMANLPTIITLLLEILIYSEITMMIHIMFFNYYCQDGDITTNYIHNMVKVSQDQKGNFLLLCIDLLIHKGSKLQEYIILIEDEKYAPIRDYLVNNMIHLGTKSNNYLDIFIVDIFNTIDSSIINKETTKITYHNTKHKVLELMETIYDTNKIIMKELMNMIYDNLLKYDKIDIKHSDRSTILQMIDETAAYNTAQLYQHI